MARSLTRKVVHCNGYSLAEDPRIPRNSLECISTEGTHEDWEYVCWDDASTQSRGRIPMTVWLAYQVDADLIIWSTGSSRIIRGDYEAEAFFKRALSSFEHLTKDFPNHFRNDLWWKTKVNFRRWLSRISTCETKSLRTHDSLIEAEKITINRFGTTPVILYSVSSANHVSRVMRDALRTFNSRSVTPAVVAAETCYGGGTVNNIQVDDLGTQLIRRS
jgi:hypothetical protein